jgi:hypothetical protein
MEWGGDWPRFKDMPHFQLTRGVGEAVMRQRFETGLDIFTGW